MCINPRPASIFRASTQARPALRSPALLLIVTKSQTICARRLLPVSWNGMISGSIRYSCWINLCLSNRSRPFCHSPSMCGGCYYLTPSCVSFFRGIVCIYGNVLLYLFGYLFRAESRRGSGAGGYLYFLLVRHLVVILRPKYSYRRGELSRHG